MATYCLSNPPRLLNLMGLQVSSYDIINVLLKKNLSIQIKKKLWHCLLRGINTHVVKNNKFYKWLWATSQKAETWETANAIILSEKTVHWRSSVSKAASVDGADGPCFSLEPYIRLTFWVRTLLKKGLNRLSVVNRTCPFWSHRTLMQDINLYLTERKVCLILIWQGLHTKFCGTRHDLFFNRLM